MYDNFYMMLPVLMQVVSNVSHNSPRVIQCFAISLYNCSGIKGAPCNSSTLQQCVNCGIYLQLSDVPGVMMRVPGGCFGVPQCRQCRIYGIVLPAEVSIITDALDFSSAAVGDCDDGPTVGSAFC